MTAVSTLILICDNEYVLRASRGRVLFDNYSHFEENAEQEIVLELDGSNDLALDRASPPEDASVPIVLSPPSTSRFELSVNNATSFPFKSMLSLKAPRTFTVKFRPPRVTENDYAWDNFQDRIVINTRLSKLVIHLEAWKHVFSPGQERSLLHPASLPDVKAPPLKIFEAIERSAVKNDSSNLRTESLPSSPPVSSVPSTTNVRLPVVTLIQSEREAREVILKLRRRRNYHNNTSKLPDNSSTSVADTELFPETVALDARTKADLENFNNLVVAAKDAVRKESEQAKSELAYYQQLLPKSSSAPETSPPLQNSRRTRHISVACKRSFKIPSLARSTSREATTGMFSSENNQEMSSLEQVSKQPNLPASQRLTKLESLSDSAIFSQTPRQQTQ
ncbi:hypothetical protein GN244_ATG06947 [Phytophthora infestans]|uniref:Uncharacterized protein n=1 Tax=Phytophthora infestans TaxID=4787 RepID=A0A833TDX0_PHYIN|nr:hypothetical protein GN244_ATG06947 [Phytophthora infestans]KAF4147988.1 hypothetical protein GN958_ATG02798 [Phytophthora infestans]